MLEKRIRFFKLNLSASIKYLLSYTKNMWTIDDYPLFYKSQTPPKDSPNPEQYPPWSVKIIRWYALFGFGNTREEAYNDLNKKIEHYRAKNLGTPRPGMRVPLQFATNMEVVRYPKVVERFFRDVLEITPFFVSDESSLFDFADGDINEYLAKTKEVFGIDVSDIQDANLGEIFDKLARETDHAQSN